MPFAVQIADTAAGALARLAFYSLPRREASGGSVPRSEAVSPVDTGTLWPETGRFVSQAALDQPNPRFAHFSNRNNSRCIASRTDCAPFALPHLSETPMPEEANGNQTRQY